MATAPGLGAALLDACTEGAKEIVLDLSELRFMDSSGLHAVLLAQETCAERGCELRLTHARPHIRQLLEITRADARLQLADEGERPHGPDRRTAQPT